MSGLRKLTPLFRLIFAALIVAVALALLYKGASGPMNAQQQERQVENKIPKSVPIEVKLTKEKEKNWKDLKNEKWAREFEIEVTNTGDRPIYTFGIRLYFDVLNEYQYELTADILYGRPEISNPLTKATKDDIPLKPGESKTFTIPLSDVLSWEKGRREKGYRLPTRVKIRIASVSFGDGTGLMGDKDGIVIPIPYRRSSLASHLVTSVKLSTGLQWR